MTQSLPMTTPALDLPLTGRCQCGGVRFACQALIENLHVCHLRMCQKAVGGSFAVI